MSTFRSIFLILFAHFLFFANLAMAQGSQLNETQTRKENPGLVGQKPDTVLAPVKEYAPPKNPADFSTERSSEILPPNENAPEIVPSLKPISAETPQSKRWGFTGNFSLFEMWVLTKYGVTGYYTQDPAWDYELEYMHGSLGFGYFGINIGSIKEDRISVLARHFGKRKSLNFLYGVFYNRMEIGLSQRFLDTVSPVVQPEVNNIDLSMTGLTWGFGNRWQTKQGYVFGIDWFVINIPFSVIEQRIPFLKQSSSEDKKDDLKDSVKWLKKFPSAGILKFQLGLTF